VSSGIRATVTFDRPDVCPVSALAAAAGATVSTTTTSVTASGPNVTEFAADRPLEGVTDEVAVTVVPVFAHDSTHRYRITHGDADCPCVCLGTFGVPVTRYVAREESLTLVFDAVDYDELRDVVAALRERFPGVDIQRFVQAPETDDAGGDHVLVDRGRLTARQLEVLETAHEMGYFARPRESNATEVATALDIVPSTVREHLVAAESKLLDDLL
jgi:predicted DNA binding protein